MKGWIRLHRGILDWEHFKEPTVLSLWICLLACTRNKAATIRGIRVEPNEAFVSYRDLHEYTGLSVNTIKAAIAKMGYPMGEDPLRRKRARYTRQKKESA